MEVEFIDKMGSDLTVVNSARVSFNRRCFKLFPEDDKLIGYLAKHKHWSPFAHASLQFRIKAPVFVARQLVKHQVGLAWNEVSRRYVDYEPEFYNPPTMRLRPDKSIKQGSSDKEVAVDLTPFYENITNLYNFLLKEMNVAPEMARMILPVSYYTEWYWSGSLYAFSRICSLRCAPDAQKETRIIADELYSHCEEHFPISWRHLTKTWEPEENKISSKIDNIINRIKDAIGEYDGTR